MGKTFALIEGGGTTFRCERVAEDGRVLAQGAVPTTSPDETLARVAAVFRDGRDGGETPAGVGLACFGPLDVDPESVSYGRMLPTPKAGWSGQPVVATLRESLGAPVAFHTDVVCAALGEWAARQDPLDRLVAYVTVGTGVGGGAVLEGVPVGGRAHAEFGHVRVPRAAGDRFVGVCPFHGDCLEGLVSGPAIRARRAAGESESSIDAFVTHALGHGLASLVLALAPDVIVLGGGVASGRDLLPPVRLALAAALGGYLPSWRDPPALARRLVAPALGERSALAGAWEWLRRTAR